MSRTDTYRTSTFAAAEACGGRANPSPARRVRGYFHGSWATGQDEGASAGRGGLMDDMDALLRSAEDAA